ncbi:MAG: uroporphyrinogen decarboxylase family protein [Deltaproteobacteria bacterium]|nr:uroporphyrinogen decarboxylase family protein [Deltaproteobacteria bacterium]
MITGMDRLVATAKGEILDRIPVYCNLFEQGAGELGMTVREYYSKGEYVAEGQIRMRAKYGYDNVWGLFYLGRKAELLGCRDIIFPTDGPPNVADFVIKTYDDIGRLRIPEDISAHPAFQEDINCLRILKNEVGGKYPICTIVTSAMTLPTLLMGMDKWMELLLLGPTDVRDELLAKCSDFFIKEITAYRDAGADTLFYSNPFGSTDTIPMKFFKKISLPWMERDLRPVGTQGVVYVCGMSRFNNVIDEIIDRLGITSFYISPLSDIAEAKKIVAGRGVVCGVINDIPLIDWSEEEIRNEVKRIIDAGMPGGKFSFGTSLMPCNIPEEKIRTMLSAAYEFGRNKDWSRP